MLTVRPAGERLPSAIAAMQRHRILGAVSDGDLRLLLARCNLVDVPEREGLFRQGDEGRSVAVVLDGFIKLSSTTITGREVVLEICGPGSLFGELAVLNGWPRSADATALSRSEVLSIPGDAFRSTLVRSPEVLLGLLGVLSRRLRMATEQISDGASLPGPARLAKALGQLAAAHGKPVGAGLQLDIGLSQRELGGLSGLSRETINKQLSAWRDRGWIELSPRYITLLAAEALREVVHGAAEA